MSQLYIVSMHVNVMQNSWSNLACFYRDIQKATQNFTTILGQGSFGPVYKATMPAGEVVAVKALASNSKQGEKEFQTEVTRSVLIYLVACLHNTDC